PPAIAERRRARHAPILRRNRLRRRAVPCRPCRREKSFQVKHRCLPRGKNRVPWPLRQENTNSRSHRVRQVSSDSGSQLLMERGPFGHVTEASPKSEGGPERCISEVRFLSPSL